MAWPGSAWLMLSFSPFPVGTPVAERCKAKKDTFLLLLPPKLARRRLARLDWGAAAYFFHTLINISIAVAEKDVARCLLPCHLCRVSCPASPPPSTRLINVKYVHGQKVKTRLRDYASRFPLSSRNLIYTLLLSSFCVVSGKRQYSVFLVILQPFAVHPQP